MSKERIVQLVQDILDADKKPIGSQSKKDLGDVVDATIAAITHDLEAGHDVTYFGFGTFKVQHRPPRQTRNPKTGETMMTEAKNTVVFKPAARLKAAMNS